MMFWTILLLGLKCGQFCDTDAHLKNVRTQLGWNARDSFLCCQQMWNYFTRNVGLFKGEKGPRALHKHMRDLLPLMLNSSTYSRGRKLVMIDVGANIGQIIPFYLSLLANQESELFLFEPNPSNFNKLVQFSRDKSDITAIQTAISEQEGTAHFDFEYAKHPTNKQGNQHGHLSSSKGNYTFEVEVHRLDTLMEQRLSKDSEVLFLKSDTEGFDFNVMLGGTGVLNQTRLYLFECHKLQRLAGSTHKKTAVFLSRLGFDVYKLSPGQLVAFGDEFYNRVVDRKKFMGWQNCLAIHKQDPIHHEMFSRLNTLDSCTWKAHE